MSNKVYISLGSNLGDRMLNIEHAYDLLNRRVGQIEKKSSIYSTKPWGFEAETDFYNSIVIINTEMNPFQLLKAIKLIERDMGRIKKKSEIYESRIIDLDIIAFNNTIIDTEDLHIPHPLMQERDFVLYPLFEVDKAWVHPENGLSIVQIIDALKGATVIKKIT